MRLTPGQTQRGKSRRARGVEANQKDRVWRADAVSLPGCSEPIRAGVDLLPVRGNCLPKTLNKKSGQGRMEIRGLDESDGRSRAGIAECNSLVYRGMKNPGTARASGRKLRGRVVPCVILRRRMGQLCVQRKKPLRRAVRKTVLPCDMLSLQ